MFNAVGFKIRFERKQNVETFIPSLKEFCHRDMTYCYIATPDEEGKKMRVITCGIAILNPIDQNDKIVGKKIALTRALDESWFNKNTRTAIWKYFWLWVSNWSSKGISVNLLKHEKTETQS